MSEQLREILDQLQAVLCDPEGQVCINGSDGDRLEIDEALSKLATLAEAQPAAQVPVTNEMVSRFLCWELPKDFGPDGGVTFTREVGTADGKRDRADMGPGWWPVGTNLLTAEQARHMLDHVLIGPAPAAPQPQCEHVWKVTSQRLLGMWSKCEKCGATKESSWD